MNIAMSPLSAFPLHRLQIFVLAASIGALLPVRAADPKDEKPAEHALKNAKVAEGFDLSLFAQPPDVGYPTSVSASPDGLAVFVAVDENGSIDRQPDRGRVLRCIDSKGEGKADKFNVFAKMDSPRGVIWEPKGKGGVLYVMHPPNLTAYYDDDGSGVAQRSEDLVTGLAFDLKFRGADHTTNGCRLGIDGWIYIACGDYGALAAKGKDGNTLHMKGGGVVRVRTDGTGLEYVSRGQRNIYDVAISPTLDIFTRDNTNDGDDWNDRLSHIVMGANYGYPSLFKNFPGDFIDALADYGGGAPVGALWLDEPGYPGTWGHGLYTVEWGRSEIDMHPLTPNGASFKPDIKQFLKITRPTDMDCDGQGHLYVTSWEGATFTYNGPNAGYVLRVTPHDLKPAPAPNPLKLTDAELVEGLRSESATWRLAFQREILHRGDRPGVPEALVKLADSTAPIATQVAAIFTLKQLSGEKATPALLSLLKKDNLREYALKALADDLRLAGKIPIQPFLNALTDTNPRVRLQAVTGVGRLGRTQDAAALIPLTADPDFVVAHIATRYLTALDAVDACLGALDSADEKAKPGALRALYGIYDVKAVDGLIARLAGAEGEYRRGLLNALCRLDQRESPYEYGKWWGTRPDTTGPVYKGEKWDGSEKVEAALKKALDTAREDDARWLVSRMYLCKVDFPGLVELMLTKAGADTTARLTAVEGMFGTHGELPPEALAALRSVAVNERENPELRSRALRMLQKAYAQAPAFAETMAAFAPLAGHDLANPALTAAFEEFTRDTKNGARIPQLAKLAESNDIARRTLAQTILVNMATNNLLKKKEKESAAAEVENAWGKPELAASLLNVIARTHARAYADQVRAKLNDPNNAVAEGALAAFQKLGLKDAGAGGGKLIGAMKYEDVVAEAVKIKGDANQGRDLFLRQGCIACHTTTPNEPPKGPMLGGIATRYSRADLCESIMKPSAKIAQGFESQWFDTRKGEHIEGFVVREGADSLEVRNIAGQSVTIETADIKARGKRDTSIMPEALVNNITPADLANLLAYLESLKAK
jgi:putative heme-binding domain-containing protein